MLIQGLTALIVPHYTVLHAGTYGAGMQDALQYRELRHTAVLEIAVVIL
jgi:hypothetical protein